MGEIKSAIELAMERTKDLVMDDREKEEAATRELGSRITALLRRYVEGMIDGDGFRKEYAKLEGQKARKNRLLIDTALSEFDLSDNNEKIFDILSFVGADTDDQLGKEIGTLQQEFNEKIAAEVKGVKTNITVRLQRMGISGDGLEPNITEWEEWKSAVNETKSLFKKRLTEWKSKVADAHVQGDQ